MTIAQLLPQHFAEVKARKQKLLDKTAKAVKERLTAEIQYWDYRAADLKQKEAAGRPNARLNSQMAARRAEELASRMQKRLAELETEKLISPAPPVVVGGALVLPGGLLRQLMGTPQPTLFSQGDKFAIELAAMNAVMQLEQAFGYLPQDVSAQKLGYDVESTIPPRPAQRRSLPAVYRGEGTRQGCPDRYRLQKRDPDGAEQAGGVSACHCGGGRCPHPHGLPETPLPQPAGLYRHQCEF